jgi:diaminopimelate epimerase
MKRRLSFAKFSATGNDFILFDNREQALNGDDAKFFQSICARRTGVGADGLLLIEKSEKTHFRMRYFNADGRESEMCGNGARAAAFYAFHNGVAPIHCTFEIGGEIYEAIVEGKAVSLLVHTPVNMKLKPGVLKDNRFEEGGMADLGVPHYVLFAGDVAKVDVEKFGKKYCQHKFFQPRRTNVNFVSVNVMQELEIRTYERGVDAETLSCGTGAVVSAFVAKEVLHKSFPITLKTRGGTLTVSIDERTGRPLLHGEVRMPFQGEIDRESF